MRYVERVRGIAAKNWRLKPRLNSTFLYDFFTGGELLAKIGGVTANGFKECDGLIASWRAHASADQRSGSMDSNSVLPVGKAIQVNRNIDIFNGMAIVTTDINGGALRQLELDEIRLEGKWLSAEVYDGNEYKRYDFAESKEICLKLPIPAITFFAEDGRKFEVGSGDDLWRYSATAGLGSAAAEMKISVSGKSLKIVRVIIDIPESVDNVISRPWRFSWFFAWNVDDKLSVQENETLIDTDKLDIPASAMILNESGVRGEVPCLLTGVCRKNMRKTVRAATGNIAFTNLDAHFCFDASHLERPNRKYLHHWDLTELFGFKLWAERRADEGKFKSRLEFKNSSKIIKLQATKALMNTLVADVEISKYE